MSPLKSVDIKVAWTVCKKLCLGGLMVLLVTENVLL